MCNKNNSGNCFSELLEKILLLQQTGDNYPLGCDKPFLGNIGLIANTRPVNLYTCCTGELWEIPYDFNGLIGVSSFFRIESINENCATFRILIPNGTEYTATNNFFIIDLNCIGSIKCLGDTLVQNI